MYATEFDIDGVDPVFGVQDDNVQLQRYQALLPRFLGKPGDQGHHDVGLRAERALAHTMVPGCMYPNGAERPALQWLVKYVENNPPTVTAGQAFTVAENLAAGSAIGTVIATDADTGQTLSQWQLTDGSGKFAIDPRTGLSASRPAHRWTSSWRRATR